LRQPIKYCVHPNPFKRIVRRGKQHKQDIDKQILNVSWPVIEQKGI
jgi:hypothetical protein